MSHLRAVRYLCASPEVVRFSVSEKGWAALMERLEAPAQINLGIAHLFSKPSVFGQGADETPTREPG